MDLTTTLRALSDPTRRRLLELLRDGETAAGDLAEKVAMSRPAISKHLAVLREAGLVVPERRGRRQIYRLDAEPLQEVGQWLEPDRPAAVRPQPPAKIARGPASRGPASRGPTSRGPAHRNDGWRCW